MAAIQHNASPYLPSWQNRFFNAANKLAIPKLIFIVLLFVVIILLNHLIPWMHGDLPWVKLDGRQLSFLIWFLVVLIAFDYFLTYAAKAMALFRPALEVNAKEYGLLTFRFVNLPNRIGWLITLVAVAAAPFVSTSFSVLPPYLQSGLPRLINIITVVFMYSLVFAFFVNIFRQFVLVGRLYARVKRINIFHLHSLYAFAGFTSRLGIFLILAGVLSFLTNVVFAGENAQITGFLFFTALNLSVAIGAFILPLGGIHARLVEEKERVSKENDQRLEAAYHKLHNTIDKNQLKNIAEMRNSIAALLDLRHEIEKVSTWPWEPGTLRNFVTALLIPLTAWGIQQLLLRTVVR